MPDNVQSLRLHGFNNLTKTLSFNIYDVCWTRSAAEQQSYLRYIDAEYSSERLTRILHEVCEIIDAVVLNVARQDYEPQGSSVTMLIAEEPLRSQHPDSVVAHLDKSHVTVHTYPEYHPEDGASTFRADIDVATCGLISPLKALNHLIASFDSDIVIMDYRVRGFTRDVSGHKLFIDHDINSIQDYISNETLARYQTIDVNVFEENIFHTKMLLNEFALDDYLFEVDAASLSEQERTHISGRLRREMEEIFYGRNMPA